MIVGALSAGTLLGVVAAALAAGVGVTVAFCAAIYCVDRAIGLHRDGSTGGAWAMSAAGMIALVACLALVAYGVITVATKS
jgi:hypothetical protein